MTYRQRYRSAGTNWIGKWKRWRTTRPDVVVIASVVIVNIVVIINIVIVTVIVTTVAIVIIVVSVSYKWN